MITKRRFNNKVSHEKHFRECSDTVTETAFARQFCLRNDVLMANNVREMVFEVCSDTRNMAFVKRSDTANIRGVCGQ